MSIDEALHELVEVVDEIARLEVRRKELASPVKAYVAGLGEVESNDIKARMETVPKANIRADRRGDILRALIKHLGAEQVAACLDPYKLGELLLTLSDTIEGCSIYFVEQLVVQKRRRRIQ